MDLLLTDGQGIKFYLTEYLEGIQLTDGPHLPDWVQTFLSEMIEVNEIRKFDLFIEKLKAERDANQKEVSNC